MYAPHDGRKGDKAYKTHEKNWSDKGDGVVDITGTGRGHQWPADDLNDLTHPYHHIISHKELKYQTKLTSL